MKDPDDNYKNGESHPPFTISPEVASTMSRGQDARRLSAHIKEQMDDLIEGLLSSHPDRHALIADALDGAATRVRGINEDRIRNERIARRKKESMRGKYICIEGPDGAGKTTFVKALQHRLITSESAAALHVWFPSDNPVGKLIRSGLRGEVELSPQAYLYLFCADGLQANAQISAWLGAGGSVVCDRHPTLSGRVFQVDRHPTATVELIYDTAAAEGILKPDVLIVLDVPPEVTLARMRSRDKYKDVVFETEDIAKVTELRRRYLALALRYKAYVLDGTLSTDVLVEQAIALLEGAA